MRREILVSAAGLFALVGVGCAGAPHGSNFPSRGELDQIAAESYTAAKFREREAES